MKSVIRKIFDGKSDEQTHSDFVKFSKGIFDNRYLIEGKKQKDRWAIKTSAEFANFFVRKCLGKVSGKVKIVGAIICTFDLRNETSFEIDRVKQFAGVKQHLINTEVNPSEIISLMEKYPKAFYALTFSGKDFELKVKAKPPKSGKPGSKEGEGPKADFCSLKTSDSEIVEDLFFDSPDFKEIKIRHMIEVKEIEILKGISDPVKMREEAIRKGVLKRFVEVDGRNDVKEMKFEI